MAIFEWSIFTSVVSFYMIYHFSEQCPGGSISRLVALELLSEQCPGRSISRLVALELLPRIGNLGFFFLMIN